MGSRKQNSETTIRIDPYDVIMGIDPGAHGGVCALYDGKISVMASTKSGGNDIAIKKIAEWSKRKGLSVVAYLEKVHSMPGQGVSSTFKFGVEYGKILGALSAFGINKVDVTPVKWQKEFVCSRRRDEAKTVHKNRLKDAAKKLYPNEKITLDTADAILIAVYGKQIESGKIFTC